MAVVDAITKALLPQDASLVAHCHAIKCDGIEGHLKAALIDGLTFTVTDLAPFLLSAVAGGIRMDGNVKEKMAQLLSREVTCNFNFSLKICCFFVFTHPRAKII